VSFFGYAYATSVEGGSRCTNEGLGVKRSASFRLGGVADTDRISASSVAAEACSGDSGGGGC
jgi:hypothetical protein